MRVARLMTRDVQCVLPETPLSHAWSLMHELKVRHLPVTLEGRLVGLVSDRDLLGHAVRIHEGLLVFDPDALTGQAMTINPVICSPGATVAEVAHLMVKNQIDCIPIVTDDNALVGLVTSTDLVALLMDKKQPLPFSFRISTLRAAA